MMNDFFEDLDVKYVIGAVVAFVFVGYLYMSSCDGKSAPKQDPYFEDYLPARVEEARKFLVDHHKLNQDYCVLVDYAIPSGSPRVFVWSFKENAMVYKAHTMHGPGGGSTRSEAVLSNVSGSNCSAPGHFAITKERGNLIRDGYYLRGLDTANKNARARAIMFHRYAYSDGDERYLPINKNICSGCVTVFNEEFVYFDNLIQSNRNLIMLWAFDSGKGIEVPVYK